MRFTSYFSALDVLTLQFDSLSKPVDPNMFKNFYFVKRIANLGILINLTINNHQKACKTHFMMIYYVILTLVCVN